ncbi:hypothetical protein SGPA1_30919 [Streptomyces misionensis JCM 4497]
MDLRDDGRLAGRLRRLRRARVAPQQGRPRPAGRPEPVPQARLQRRHGPRAGLLLDHAGLHAGLQPLHPDRPRLLAAQGRPGDGALVGRHDRRLRDRPGRRPVRTRRAPGGRAGDGARRVRGVADPRPGRRRRRPLAAAARPARHRHRHGPAHGAVLRHRARGCRAARDGLGVRHHDRDAAARRRLRRGSARHRLLRPAGWRDRHRRRPPRGRPAAPARRGAGGARRSGPGRGRPACLCLGPRRGQGPGGDPGVLRAPGAGRTVRRRLARGRRPGPGRPGGHHDLGLPQRVRHGHEDGAVDRRRHARADLPARLPAAAPRTSAGGGGPLSPAAPAPEDGKRPDSPRTGLSGRPAPAGGAGGYRFSTAGAEPGSGRPADSDIRHTAKPPTTAAAIM